MLFPQAIDTNVKLDTCTGKVEDQIVFLRMYCNRIVLHLPWLAYTEHVRRSNANFCRLLNLLAGLAVGMGRWVEWSWCTVGRALLSLKKNAFHDEQQFVGKEQLSPRKTYPEIIRWERPILKISPVKIYPDKFCWERPNFTGIDLSRKILQGKTYFTNFRRKRSITNQFVGTDQVLPGEIKICRENLEARKKKARLHPIFQSKSYTHTLKRLGISRNNPYKINLPR